MTDLARVETSRVGTTQVFRVTGELDLSNARSVTDSVSHGVPELVTLVVLDLAGTTFLDSAAIASLFRLVERLRDRRQDLRLVIPRDAPIRAVVELTRLSHVVPVDDSAPDLLDTLRAYAALPPSATEATARAGDEEGGSGSGDGSAGDGSTGDGSAGEAPGGTGP